MNIVDNGGNNHLPFGLTKGQLVIAIVAIVLLVAVGVAAYLFTSHFG